MVHVENKVEEPGGNEDTKRCGDGNSCSRSYMLALMSGVPAL